MMKLLKASWILLFLLLLAALLLTGSRMALAALLCAVLLPVLGLACALGARKGVTLRWHLPVNLEKGQQSELTLELHNPTVFPVFRAGLRLTAENRLTGARETKSVSTFLLPKSTQRVTLHFCGEYCGRVQLTADRLRLQDGFGLLGIPSAAEHSAGLTVQPKAAVRGIRISADASCPDDSETYSKEKPGFDLSEPFAIREYREGDSPRRIHWKLSCKLDRLIVREPSLPVTRSVMVFWERTGKACRSGAETDRQAEAVVSALRALTDASVPYTAAWNDVSAGTCVLQEVRDLDDLIGLLPRLLSARGSEEGASGAEMLARSAGEATFSHILYIGGEDNAASADVLTRFGRVTPWLISGGGEDAPTVSDLTI